MMAGGGGMSGYNAEKVAQIIAWFVFAVGMVETFFVIKDSKSFLAANIPYLQFDITSPAYGFVIAITMAVTLAVALGLGLRTIAIIGILFWLAVSGMVSCSSKGVRLTTVDQTNLAAGEKRTNGVEDTLARARENITKRVGKENPEVAEKRVETEKELFAAIDKSHPEFSAAIKRNDGEEWLASGGYTVKRVLTKDQIAWCETEEAITAMIAGNFKAWANCATGKAWNPPIHN